MTGLEKLLVEGVADRLPAEHPDAPERAVEAAAMLLCAARSSDEEGHVLVLLDAMSAATPESGGRTAPVSYRHPKRDGRRQRRRPRWRGQERREEERMTKNNARMVTERIELRAQHRGIDVLDAADEVYAAGGGSATDYPAAVRLAQRRRETGVGTWVTVADAERLKALAEREGVSEEEAYDRLAPGLAGKAGGYAGSDRAVQRAEVRRLNEREGIPEDEAERRLYDEG